MPIQFDPSVVVGVFSSKTNPKKFIMKKILLLDIENCPQTSDSLLSLCKQYQQVELVYATSNLSLNLDALHALQPYIQLKVLNVFKMPSVGKNAADFGLAFVAGQLSQSFAANETEFSVMSNDHAMTYVVDLLKLSGFKANLLQTKVNPKSLQLCNATTISNVEFSDAVKNPQIIQELSQRLKHTLVKLESFPKKRESLQSAIQSWLKVDAKMANKLIALLVEQKIVKIQGQTVSYEIRSNAYQLHESNEKAKIPSPTDIAQVSHLRDLKIICDHLYKHERTRPSKNITMHNMIKALLKIEKSTILNNRYKLLKKYQIITENSLGKLNYQQQHIKRWADIKLPEVAGKIDINSEPVFLNADSSELHILATRLDQLSLNKPKFLAGFTELIKKLFPAVDAQKYVTQLLDDGVIGLDGRKIIYQIPLTMH